MSWKNAPIKFGVEVLRDADKLTKRITGEMLATVVVATPIDTSAARQNWRVGVGAINPTADTKDTDGSGQGAINRGIATIQSGGGIGKIIFLSNSLKYISRLNSGWSMQAPKNFMQISFMNVVNKYR